MKKLHASGEDYLESILILQKRIGSVRSVGADPKTAEDDACRIEHVISDESFQILKSVLKTKQVARTNLMSPNSYLFGISLLLSRKK